jgi:CheY-like chemotaxis protein
MATRILIAEDDKSVREYIGRALRHAGYEVAPVNYRLTALEALRAKPYDRRISEVIIKLSSKIFDVI